MGLIVEIKREGRKGKGPASLLRKVRFVTRGGLGGKGRGLLSIGGGKARSYLRFQKFGSRTEAVTGEEGGNRAEPALGTSIGRGRKNLSFQN